MKVLSFLGTGNYQETTYEHEGQRCRTRFFPVAVCAFYQEQVNEAVLLVTQKASEAHLEALQDELRRCSTVALRPVLIPDGKTPDEIWSLFQVLVDQVATGDQLVLDGTHGFRSLPVLAVIAAAYLRVAKDVTIHRMLYGAYEARTADGPAGRSPVFDLTAFLTLLEWSAAADLFKRTGNAEPLAGLLVATQNELYRPEARAPELPKKLKSTGQALASLSEAMRLIRVHEVMRTAGELVGRLERTEAEAAQWAKPFAVLLDQLRQRYAPFAVAEPAADPDRDLAVQLEMVRWYATRGWGAEAAALAREWVVSVECYRAGISVLSKDGRTEVEQALNAAVEAMRLNRAGATVTESSAALDLLAESVDVWTWLPDLRNDILHAGMRVDPRSSAVVGRDVGGLPGRLQALAKALWGPESAQG